MNYASFDITFQEIPGEISLVFLISGCPNNCENCHSQYTKHPQFGSELTDKVLVDLLEKYGNLVTCVLFEGGEWESERLQELLEIARSHGLKTALYTGLDKIDPEISEKLNYLKTGPFIEDSGGLDSESTNQKLMNLDTDEDITYKLRR